MNSDTEWPPHGSAEDQKSLDSADAPEYVSKQTPLSPGPASISTGSPGLPVPEEMDINMLKRKLRKLKHDKRLSSEERAYLVKLLASHSAQAPLKRRNEDGSLGPEMKHRKLQVNLIATRDYSTQTDQLLNYKPELNASAAANDIMIQRKRLAKAEKIKAAIAADLMSKTFDQRRNFIRKKRPLALFVKEKYPLLFSNAEVRNEIDRIFYDGKCSEFLVNVEKYAQHILSVAQDDDPLLLETRNKMDALQTLPQKQYAQEVGALLMLSSLVNENRDYIHLCDQPNSPDDFPYIQCEAEENDLYFDQHIFKIYVERTQLCEAPDFKEAVLCLMGCYFIFNIRYPVRNFHTLVCFEKLFFVGDNTDDVEVDLYVRQMIRSIQLKWSAESDEKSSDSVKVCENKTKVPEGKLQKVSHSTNKQDGSGVPKKKKNKQQQQQIRNSPQTDFLPVGRSCRKPLPEVLKKQHKELEEAILSGREDGFEVKVFPDKGRGVVARKALKRGDFALEYAGELIDYEESQQREMEYSTKEKTGCYLYYFKLSEERYCIDATEESGRLGRLINHSKKGNLKPKLIYLQEENPHICFFACKDIEIGEELCYDYGDRSKKSLNAHPWLAL